MKKNIPPNEAIILACTENFHGRTISIISFSTDASSKKDFGPFVPNIGAVCPATKRELRHGNIQDLEDAFKAHGPKVAAFLLEPIQGEAGINVPADGYLTAVRELCTKYNVCGLLRINKLGSIYRR
jgi:ornithine--oxo-acid transaminase